MVSQLCQKKKIATTSTSQNYVPITNFDGKFIKSNTTKEEVEDRDILGWLYKYEDESILNIKIPTEQYGKGYTIMQRMGYEGNGPIRKIKEVIIEPIQPNSIHPNDKTRLGLLTREIISLCFILGFYPRLIGIEDLARLR
jgi:hypothetical protein